MSSSWREEIGAVFQKEVRTELRSKSGILTAGLFSVITVVAIAFGSSYSSLDATLAAGLLWVALTFAATISLPRIFLAEEEQGTADLLRLIARPHAVFWGKALFNLAQLILQAVVLSLLFVVLVRLEITSPIVFAAGLALGCAALAGAVTFCAALVAQASNRAVLAAVIALPLLIPLIAVGIAALRVSLGAGLPEQGTQALLGLLGYAGAVFAAGPHLFAAVWKN